jgi:dipeptidase E
MLPAPSFILLLFTATILEASTVRKIYVAGSGLDMFSLAETVTEVIRLSGLAKPHILYVGTATYDDPWPFHEQTKGFAERGCRVSALNVAWLQPSATELKTSFATADVILLSGGNTLFAADRWVKLGIDVLMKQALNDGAVLSGGSAGFISLCNGGHSDSMAPDSYKNPPGPLLNPSAEARVVVDANWAYIRAPGIGIINSLCCPHYDMTGSNGVHRAVDFAAMLQRHSGEDAIGVDNFAALVITGDSYRVISRAGKPGSAGPDGSFVANRTGVPAVWRLRTDSESGVLVRTLVPVMGELAAILVPPRYLAPETQLAVARQQNPDDGHPADWNSTGSATLVGSAVRYLRRNPGWWH